MGRTANQISSAIFMLRTCTSKHSAVRCCLFIGSKATGLYNQHEAEMVIRPCRRGGIFGLAKRSVPGDVVVNVGTTYMAPPRSLVARSKI